MSAAYEHLIVEEKGAVVTATMNRPTSLNALNTKLVSELRDFFVNLYWSLGGYLKITYFTCFYMWARECERQGSSDPRLAPAPLEQISKKGWEAVVANNLTGGFLVARELYLQCMKAHGGSIVMGCVTVMVGG